LTGASASPALRLDSKKSGASLLPEQPAMQEKTSMHRKTAGTERNITFIVVWYQRLLQKYRKRRKRLATFTRYVNGIQLSCLWQAGCFIQHNNVIE
jgi:hypothetical protein